MRRAPLPSLAITEHSRGIWVRFYDIMITFAFQFDLKHKVDKDLGGLSLVHECGRAGQFFQITMLIGVFLLG